jgi:hypothetical protein
MTKEIEPTEVEEGDEVRVTYRTAKGKELGRTGEVTSKNEHLKDTFTIDTGDEYDDGTPKTVGVDSHRVVSDGRVQSKELGELVKVERLGSD